MYSQQYMSLTCIYNKTLVNLCTMIYKYMSVRLILNLLDIDPVVHGLKLEQIIRKGNCPPVARQDLW